MASQSAPYEHSCAGNEHCCYSLILIVVLASQEGLCSMELVSNSIIPALC